MNKHGSFLTRYRNAFLTVLLMTTLVVAGLASQERLRSSPKTVAIPVVSTAASVLTPLEIFRQERDTSVQADMAALQALCDQPLLEDATREDAADRLQELVAYHQAQLALEGALSLSSLAPCAAVVTQGSVTIVTEKQEITDRDSALVLSLAAAHANTPPSGVRIITAE